MEAKNLSTFQIHKLSQEQYDAALAADKIDEYALYLTPDDGTSIDVATINSDGLMSANDKEQLKYGGIPILCAESIQVLKSDNTMSGDGEYYKCDFKGFNGLVEGMVITIIPDTKSSILAPRIQLYDSETYDPDEYLPKLDPLSDYSEYNIIQMPLSNKTNTVSSGASTDWISANTPIMLQYSKNRWLTVAYTRPQANSFSGTVKIANGGTGASTAKKAIENLGAMASANPTGTGSFSLNRASDSTIGDYSVAEGNNTIASEQCSHAEGYMTQAKGKYSHAEGGATVAVGIAAHASGVNTTAIGNYSYAGGGSSKSLRSLLSSGESLESFTEGDIKDKWINNSKEFSAARGNCSHVEGLNNLAIGEFSHVEGRSNLAMGDASHAEGEGTTASEYCSHAEGYQTTASGKYSHAEGELTTASGECSHAEGYCTNAYAHQHAQGHYNKAMSIGEKTGTTGTAFVIGNGIGVGAANTSNAFFVTYSGSVYSQTGFYSSGADYAEYFEWEDSNSYDEDRRGYFVTLDGEKIKIAKPNDYILGIVSALPAVIGNGDIDWRGRYVLDDFGSLITEEFEYEEEVREEVVNEETGETTIETKTVTKTGTRYKQNPDYDPTLPYVQRADRPEWATVGMMGVLHVRDDGTCQVNGFCKVAEGGIATASESGYRVIKRVSDNIVKVVFR